MAAEYPSDTPSRRRSVRRARGGRAERTGYADTSSGGTGTGDRRFSGAESGDPELDDSWVPGMGGPGSGNARTREPEDPEARAREVCLRLLTIAPRTRAQLAEALAKRGVPDEVADDVLGRFTSAGLVDDAAFARAWVESRHHGRGLSGRALAAELRQRGVDDDQISEAVEQLGPDAEVETARQLVARRLPATRGQSPEARMRRLAGMLARKGYPPGLAFRVIREALEAEGTDAEALIGDEVLFEDEPGDN